MPDPSHVLYVASLELHADMSYEERPIRIVDKKYQVLRHHTIMHVKV